MATLYAQLRRSGNANFKFNGSKAIRGQISPCGDGQGLTAPFGTGSRRPPGAVRPFRSRLPACDRDRRAYQTGDALLDPPSKLGAGRRPQDGTLRGGGTQWTSLPYPSCGAEVPGGDL